MSQSTHKQRRGFTLIELLIVIAIIAILALIAIPNFLEAQVRARVSRAHADMRSVGTALEAYCTDNNVYPLCTAEYKDLVNINQFPDVTGNRNNRACLSRLTTPIAYITTFPPDPFTEKGTQKKEGVADPEGERLTFAYKALHMVTPPFSTNNNNKIAWNKGYRWVLDSLGPSRATWRQDAPDKNENPWNIFAGAEPLDIYDPTNGTVSHGMIIRTNKGVYAGQDYLQ